MRKPTHAILYTRVSTQEQAKGRNGLEGQLQALHQFCEREGISPVMHHEEVASGGLGIDGRPLLGQAFDIARRIKACVLVSKLDRLSREVKLIADLMDSKAEFYTAEDGLDCPPLMLHMKAVIAEHERKVIGDRTKTALAVLKGRGVVLGINAHKEESSKTKARLAAAAAKKAYSDEFAAKVAPTLALLRRAGLTYEGMASELNRMKVPTMKGGMWYASTVSNVLKRVA